MSNTDNQPSLTSTVSALFSPTTLAAVRYALQAMAPVLALFGFAGLTPDKIDFWVTYAKSFGTAALAVIALVGIVLPLVIAIFGILSATVKKQIARVRELAANPQLANQEAQKAIIEATKAIASDKTIPKSLEAVDTLVAATIALPQVQTIVTDKRTANATTSQDVVEGSAIKS